VGVALSAFSHGERAELGLEDLVGIDAHGREFPGNFQAHQAVQAAPDKHGRKEIMPADLRSRGSRLGGAPPRRHLIQRRASRMQASALGIPAR
jgi:hypothetical protein